MRRRGRSGGHHLRQSHRGQVCAKCKGLPGARWRQAQSRFARGLGESPSVAQLVRLLQTLNLGFTRRQAAFGECGKSCGRLRATAWPQSRRHDKELEMEGVFMNTRTKFAIAASAAIWMFP